ncbi:MAG: hypothetical protein GY753_16380 [Gammaproteobacteria bacterium]|nr:hypothetical protein [Gammaproteobacteria bacterium]
MITKYDMTSGEQIHQTGRRDTETVAPAAYGTTTPALSLQLVTVETLPKQKIMPADLTTGSISDFLRQQS